MNNFYMFHDIREKNQTFFPGRYDMQSFITPDKFNKILHKIKSDGANFLQLENSLTDCFSQKTNLSVLTFDDGLIDHLEVARYLYESNIRAIFFIPYAPIYDSVTINSHKIQFVLASMNITTLVKELTDFYFQHHESARNSDLDHFFVSRWKNNLWPREMIFFTRVLREAGTRIWRDEAVNHLFCKYVTNDEKSFSSDFYLLPEHVDEISDLGHIIGGHGNYSLDLRFEEADIIEDEILISKKFVNKYSSEDFLFAYANGGATPLAFNILCKAGFIKGFGTDNLDADLLNDAKYKNCYLPRIDGTKLL